jgi:hypothetical protein
MKIIVIITAILFFVSNLAAQDHAQITTVSLELDPAPFILGGYSFSLKYSPAKMPKTTFLASVFGADFPNSMMNKINQERGWNDLIIRNSYAFFTDFFLKDGRVGFHFGPSIFLYNKSVELSSVMERTKFTTLYPNLRVGYVWYPFQKIDLYLNPWFNIGSEINLDKNNELNGIEFESNKLYYIAAIHLGYSLNW